MATREDIRRRMNSETGKVTRWEKHWLWCMDKGLGWVHPMNGPYAKEFVADYPNRRLVEAAK